MQEVSLRLRFSGKSIGFVPTMGYLHQGHISLLHAAKKETDCSVVSIFVNPSQFGPNEDFSRYPRDEQRDLSLLAEHGCDFVFFPDKEEIYPHGFSYSLIPGPVASVLEGEIRPGHFSGVATIVNLLFNIVQPFAAYFGQKDAQQSFIITKMVKDLRLPVKVVICPVIREADGLAMSSRNVYLSAEQRGSAPLLYKSLLAVNNAVMAGEHNTAVLRSIGMEVLKREPALAPDYFEIVSLYEFETAPVLVKGSEYFILVAARLGATRLIDNIIIRI